MLSPDDAAYPGVKASLLQKMHPPRPQVPSLFGQPSPALTGIFRTLPPKRDAKYAEMVGYGADAFRVRREGERSLLFQRLRALERSICAALRRVCP